MAEVQIFRSGCAPSSAGRWGDLNWFQNWLKLASWGPAPEWLYDSNTDSKMASRVTFEPIFGHFGIGLPELLLRRKWVISVLCVSSTPASQVTVSKERTHWVLHQPRWVLRRTQWVCFATQIGGWKELSELSRGTWWGANNSLRSVFETVLFEPYSEKSTWGLSNGGLRPLSAICTNRLKLCTFVALLGSFLRGSLVAKRRQL